MTPPDYTIIIQFVIFLLTWMVIGKLLFKPIASLLKERRGKTVGVRQETDKLLEKVEGLAAEYQTRMEEVKKEASKERERIRKESLRMEREIREQAKQEAAQIISELRVRLEEESVRVRETLREKANELSQDLASQVLGRRL